MDLSGNARESNRNGANIALWHLNGDEARAGDRRVRFIPHGTEGLFIIEFQNGGRVADVSNSSAPNNANIHAWSRHNGRNQQWRFIQHENRTTFIIQTAVNDRVVHTHEGRIGNDGANLQMGNRTSSRSQQFTFVYAEGPLAGREFEAE